MCNSNTRRVDISIAPLSDNGTVLQKLAGQVRQTPNCLRSCTSRRTRSPRYGPSPPQPADRSPRFHQVSVSGRGGQGSRYLEERPRRPLLNLKLVDIEEALVAAPCRGGGTRTPSNWIDYVFFNPILYQNA